MVAFEALSLDPTSPVREEGRNELLSDLRQMVNNSDSGDVTLKCNDGITIHASRWLLANRCTVFKSMLCNGMLETKLSEIQLVNFPSRVMLPIVEYLYTGTVESYLPVDWRMGVEMIGAAQYFMIPRVQVIAQDFLRSWAARVWEKPDVVDMLGVALEFPEDWEGKHAVLVGFVNFLGSDWCDEHFAHKLSRSAVEYILLHSWPDRVQEGMQRSFEEYFTFRQVVLWHAYQLVPVDEVEKRAAVRSALPGKFPLDDWRRMLEAPVDIDGFWAQVTNPESRSLPGDLSSLLQTDVYIESLQQMLLHINLSRIPASLLLKVIHPLQVFSHGELLKALVQRAFHRHVQYSVTKSDWKHGSSLRTGGEGQVICSHASGEGKGTAIAFIPTRRSKEIYEWSFEVIDNDAGFIEVGFIRLPVGRIVEQNEIVEESLSDLSLTGMICIERDEHCTSKMRTDLNSGLDAWESREHFGTEVGKYSVVTFTLNLTENTCKARFSNTFDAIWAGLQEGDYYPAVGFHSCRCASVRLKLLSGFDFDSAGEETVPSGNESAS